MPKTKWYGRDTSLQFRMIVTMLLLTVLYIVFSVVLFAFTKAAILLIIIPIAGLFIQYYFSDKLVLASSGARIVGPGQLPEVQGVLERLAQQVDLPTPRLAVIDSNMPNAFATGRSPKHAVIAVTTGLLNQLSPREVEAVLAHEMTHVRNRDMVVMTMAGSFAAVASWIVQMSFWFGLGAQDDRRDNNNGMSFFVFLLISVAVAFISHILVMALSRYREYAADRGSAILTGAPEHLESALLRISGTMSRIPNEDLRKAQPLSALYFAAPSKQSVVELFSDHPSVEKRIARLQRLERGMVRP